MTDECDDCPDRDECAVRKNGLLVDYAGKPYEAIAYRETSKEFGLVCFPIEPVPGDETRYIAVMPDSVTAIKKACHEACIFREQ